jgi:membrane fusion protein, copper/silver efflux system
MAHEGPTRYRFNIESMKRITLYGVLFAAGCAVLIGAASWSGRRDTVGASNVTSRKILYYVDPMHPSYRSDKPGTAPDCGMKLEPVYEGSPEPALQSSDGLVRISTDRRELVGVRIEAAKQEARTERLRLYGRVAPEETRIYGVNVGIEGYVREISDVTTGSQVTKD